MRVGSTLRGFPQEPKAFTVVLTPVNANGCVGAPNEARAHRDMPLSMGDLASGIFAPENHARIVQFRADE
jgi:hypothetical protein